MNPQMKSTVVNLYHRIFDMECQLQKDKIDYQYCEEEPLVDDELQRLRLAVRKAKLDELKYTLQTLKKQLDSSR